MKEILQVIITKDALKIAAPIGIAYFVLLLFLQIKFTKQVQTVRYGVSYVVEAVALLMTFLGLISKDQNVTCYSAILLLGFIGFFNAIFDLWSNMVTKREDTLEYRVDKLEKRIENLKIEIDAISRRMK